jgi:hypothetical protein
LADSGNPNLCGTTTELAVTLGDEVNICYTVTNQSSTTLNYQSLSDDHVGQLLTNNNVTLAPGASYQYNRTIIASTNPNSDTGTFSSTWTATDILPGYVFDDTAAFQFVDISSTGTPLTLDMGAATTATMPFAFPLFGMSSTDLCIGNNGEFRVTSTCPFSPNLNLELPASNLNAPAVLPYWDLMLSNGTIYYGTVGTAPNRQFIVQYQNKFNYGDGGDPTGQTGATFEAILNESDNTVDFEYQTATFGGAATDHDNGASATVGLQFSSSLANQYSYNSAVLHDGLAIKWTPTTPIGFTSTAAATLDVGSPTMITTPNAATGFSPTVAAGNIASAPLLIDNVGNRDLNWSLAPPSARSHFPKTPRVVQPFGSSWAHSSPFGPLSRFTDAPVPAQTLGTDVPIYAAEAGPGFDNYVTLDANDPGTFNTIQTGLPEFWGLTFVNDDFTKQYAVEFLTGNLDTISTADGSVTFIGNVGLTSCCTVTPGGLRWDATTGLTYLVIVDYINRVSTLYTVDLNTAMPTLVGPMSGLILDITLDQSGLMYGIDVDADALVAIDKTNGETQVIGSIGFDAIYGQGLDFDPQTGILYLASTNDASSRMYSVDPQTGATTLIGQLQDELDTMAIAKPGVVCSTPSDTPWLTYDVSSGTVTPDPDMTHPATVNVSFDATNLAPGSYSARVCVYGNDLSHARIAIPVSLTVESGGPPDEIFGDGFDGAGGTGPVSIAQTSDMNPVSQNSVACGNSSAGTTADNQYWRRYYFNEYSVPSPAAITSVDVSVEQTSGAPDVTVTLYTLPHGVSVDTIDITQLAQIGQATVPSPANASLVSMNVPVAGVVADTTANDLVVEVSTDDGTTEGTAFYIGSTPSPETHPSFLSSAGCGITDPTPTADIGFPDMHIIEAVNIGG